MIDPYLAVGLQTKIKHVATRPEVEKNLIHIEIGRASCRERV